MDQLTIVYIDDDAFFTRILTLALQKHRIGVHHIADVSATSLARLQSEACRRACAVFFDLRLGADSGLDLARQLRQQGDRRPFFLVTNAEAPEQKLLAELDLTYLQKPLDIAEIVMTLRQFCDGN